LSDTVGFIRKLPHHLIESFKSTLDEVAESDILLHVVDFPHPVYLDQMEIVNKTLSELGAGEKPQIVIYNKIDQIKPEEGDEFEGNMQEYFESKRLMNGDDKDVIYISATQKSNIDELKKLIIKKVRKQHLKIYPNYLAPDTY